MRSLPLWLLLTVALVAARGEALLLDTCQGIDDTAAIQAAIDGHSEVMIAAGSVCVVTPDTRQYALRIDKDDFRLTLESGAVIRLADGALAGITRGYLLQLGDGVTARSNLRVVGPGTLDGNRSQNPLEGGGGLMSRRAAVRLAGPLSDVAIEGLRIVGASGIAVLVEGQAAANAEHIRIRDNFLFDNEEGINFKNADFVTVQGNHILETAIQDGVEPNIGGEHWTVSDNLIEQTLETGGAAINPFKGAANGIISGNVVRGHVVGIDLQDVAGISVLGNDLSNTNVENTGKGILVKGNASDSSLVIQANRVHGYLTGIQLNDGNVLLQDNTIVGTGGNGILWNAGSRGRILGNVVEQPNQESGSGRAIQVNAGSDLLIRGNRFSDVPESPFATVGAWFKSGVSDVRFEDNEIEGFAGLPVRDFSGGGVAYRGNRGFATESRGTAVIASPESSVVVLHGLDLAPVLSDIQVTPTSGLGAASTFWISEAGATSFRIHVDADPGPAGASFAWSVGGG